MNNEQTIKLLKLQVQLDEELRKSVPAQGARHFLLEEIINTPAGKSHVKGTLPPPSARDLADQVWATDGGQRLRDILDQHEESEAETSTTDKDRKLAEINAIENPRERINAARAAGLA